MNENRCKELRKKAGITLRQLAAKSSIAMQKVGGFESQRTELSVQEMWRIADALDCTMDELEPLFWNRPDVQK